MQPAAHVFPPSPLRVPSVFHRARDLLVALAFIMLTACSGFARAETNTAPQPKPPNIVMIFTDDQRHDAVGYTGNTAIHTPNLDRLARRGTVFQNCFVNTSICSISRANLLTGQYPGRHGIDDFLKTLSPKQLERTVPARLQQAGYQTAFFGKWGIGDSPERTLEGAAVFDYWAGQPMQTCFFHDDACRYVQSNGFARPCENLCNCPPDSRGIAGFHNRIGLANLPNPLHVDADVIPAQVARFLSGRNPDKPFCLFLFFKSPHSPFGDWDRTTETITNDLVMPVPPGASLALAKQEPAIIRQSLGSPTGMQFLKNPPMLDKHLRDYYRLIASMDKGVGRIVELISKENEDSNTVVLFTSDNGHFLGEHGLAEKWLMHEPSLRVPGFLYDPRQPSGQIRRELVITTDFSVTMLALAGLDPPADMTGRDLCPLSTNEPVPWRHDFYYDHPYGHNGKIPRTVGVRTDQFSYIRYIDTSPPYEQLFDLHDDPNQLHNLAAHPAAETTEPDRLHLLRARCDTLAREVGPTPQQPHNETNTSTNWNSLEASVASDTNPKGLTATVSGQPNILLIVADDLGYSDLGCFGGELDTPALDRLAARGARFTNALVNPMCVVTRTSLLTGQTHTQSDNYRNSIPFPLFLQQAGYQTSIAGKWHQPGNPLDAGFDHFYGFLGGEINSWTGQTANRDVIQTDRKAPQPVPTGWYASDAFTADCIESINSAVRAKKPFFCYLPFNAPHGPHHAPRSNVEKYDHRFDAGWDEMRRVRYQRMLRMGIIDDRYKLSTPEAEIRRWDELPLDRQRLESKRFQAYAGMVDRMDANIGRILNHLDTCQLTENTLIIFFSDNGGDYGHGDARAADREVPWEASSPRPAHANGWSLLKNTPFRWYKSSAYQGGVASPLIVSWPRGLEAKPGSLQRQRVHVTDWYPTFLELAGASPSLNSEQKKLQQGLGSSLLPLFRDPQLPELAVHNKTVWEYEDISKGLLRDHWKIVSINDGPWKLFNVADDPAEANELADQFPEVKEQLAREWYDFENMFPWTNERWRRPLKTEQQGWGLHRLRLAMPVLSLNPPLSATDVPLETTISFTFTKKPAVPTTGRAAFQLFSSRTPATPVYVFGKNGTGSATVHGNTLTLHGIPQLEPDTTYFAFADPGWIAIDGKPTGPINDGAIWYRFRTQKEPTP